MPAYDTVLFDPPAPLAQVALRNPENLAVLSDVPMLLDSGADVTLIPQASVNQLGIAADPGKSYELVGFNGSTSFAPVCSATASLPKPNIQRSVFVDPRRLGCHGAGHPEPCVPVVGWPELEVE